MGFCAGLVAVRFEGAAVFLFVDAWLRAVLPASGAAGFLAAWCFWVEEEVAAAAEAIASNKMPLSAIVWMRMGSGGLPSLFSVARVKGKYKCLIGFGCV